MRIVTWNVNSLAARLPRVLSWLVTAQPDVLCLQETKLAQDAFPFEAVAELGYTAAHRGQGQWNGIAVLSRIGLEVVAEDIPGVPGFPMPDGLVEARFLHARCGQTVGAEVDVVNVYVPNGRGVDDPHYAYKLAWLEALRADVTQFAGRSNPYAVLGDYNVAPTDADVWDPAVFIGSTHVTPAERQALAGLRDTGLIDIVPTIAKGPHPYTFWDYRGGNFHKQMGMRIDLIYANPAFANAVTAAEVDREARKPGVKGTPAPSDHAPVVVDLTF